MEGEFPLEDWQAAGLNMASVVKRGLFTIHESLVLKQVGKLTPADVLRVNESLKRWLSL